MIDSLCTCRSGLDFGGMCYERGEIILQGRECGCLV